MEPTAHGRFAAAAPTRSPPPAAMASSSQSRGPETWPNVPPSGVAAAPAPPGVAAESRAQQQAVDQHDKNAAHHHSFFLSTDEHFSQSDPRSAEGSQASNATSASDQVFTPTPSDDYNNNTASNHDSSLQSARDMSSQDSQLRQLSALAATRDRMQTDGHDAPAASRKRMADGEVKSPIRGHSRNTSTMSMASTTSTIGDLSHDLRTRLSYAMVKVNNGWQAHNLDQIETLASQAVSPASTASTTTRRRAGSSASPQLTGGMLAHAALSNGLGLSVTAPRKLSSSPPSAMANRPTLAPPAPIRPSAEGRATSPPKSTNPRRNSNPTYTPTLLSHSHSASTTPGVGGENRLHQRGPPENLLQSPHQNVREQDAIETLLFMSSPNNSANVKHTFSPQTSPDPSFSQPTPRSAASGSGSGARHALPGGPRKALPSQRPSAGAAAKRVGFGASPTMAPLPDSPMDIDTTPQHTPNRWTPRRRTNQHGGSSHVRSALSLPSALGITHATSRQPMTDQDIDQMLDRADERYDSSDNEEIQLPPRSNRGIRA